MGKKPAWKRPSGEKAKRGKDWSPWGYSSTILYSNVGFLEAWFQSGWDGIIFFFTIRSTNFFMVVIWYNDINRTAKNLITRYTTFEYKILLLCPHNLDKCVITCKCDIFTWKVNRVTLEKFSPPFYVYCLQSGYLEGFKIFNCMFIKTIEFYFFEKRD